MPITKNGQGQIIYSQPEKERQFELTGVVNDNDFAVADKLNVLKQIQFDVNPTTTGPGVLTLRCDVAGDTTLNLTSITGGNAFGIVQPDTGTSPTAIAASDTLTITSSNSSLSIAGNSATNTLTINAGSSLATLTGNQILTNKTISGASNTLSNIGYSSLVLTGGIVNADVSSSAAIAHSKLAALTSTNILVGNGSNVPTAVAVSGDATLANTGALTVTTVGTSSAANIHTAELAANAATSANTPSTIVARNGSGNFTAGTITAALTGNATTATSTPTVSTLTTLGDSLYGGVAGATTALSGNITATKKFLSQTGTGSVSAAPAWGQPAFSDITGTAAVTQGGTGLTSTTTGDLYYASGANTIAALPAGTNLQVLRQVAGVPAWSNQANLSTISLFSTDCEAALNTNFAIGIFNTTNSGTTGAASGTVAPINGSNNMGIWSLATGTNSAGLCRITAGSTTFLPGTGRLIQEWIVQIPVASNGTDTYSLSWGCHDTNTINATHGVYLQYDSTTSANFLTVTSDNGTRTITTTSTAVPIATWFRITMDINAAGTRVDFYINGVNIGNNTTNIPTATGRATKVAQCMILKSAGSTSVLAYIDAYSHLFIPVSAR